MNLLPSAGSNEQLSFVERQISSKISSFKTSSSYNRHKAFLFTIASASLSAIATVAIGASKTLEINWLAMVALLASGAATVVGAWESLFANRRLWVVDGAILAALNRLKDDIDFRKSDESRQLAQDEVEEFYSRYKNIVDESEKAWASIFSGK